MPQPDFRATRKSGRRVYVEVTEDPPVQRTRAQKTVVIGNRMLFVERWLRANGGERYRFREESIFFETDDDATLFYLTFA